MTTTVYVLDADPQERTWIETALAPTMGAVVFVQDRAGLLARPPLADRACLLAFADRDETAALALVTALRRTGSKLPVIVLGPLSAFRTAVDIARLDATDFLERPVSAHALCGAIRRVCTAVA